MPNLKDLARSLRKDDTIAEKIAWILLRDRRTLGLKFRRQLQIDRYIVDFYCSELALIVEIDGDVHHVPAQLQKDLGRDRRLKELG